MVDYCERCGALEGPDKYWMCYCVLPTDTRTLEALLSAAANDVGAALKLSEISQPEALPFLETLVEMDVEYRATIGALSSLGTVASADSWQFMVAKLPDVSPHFGQNEVVRYFARLGSPEAIDLLVELLDDDIHASCAALALAHHKHPSAIPQLIEIARTAPNATHLSGYGPGPWATLVLEAFNDMTDLDKAVAQLIEDQGGLGADAALRHLQSMQRSIRQPEPEALEPGFDVERNDAQITARANTLARQALSQMGLVVSDVCGEPGIAALQAANESLQGQFTEPLGRPAIPVRPPMDPFEIPDGVTTTTAYAIDWPSGDPSHPGTRFRGQPTWRGDPTWPLGFRGTPMSFWAQFEFPDDPSKMAYLFLDRDGWNQHVEDAVCLIVQPDGVPPAKFEMRARGPQVPGHLSRTDDRFQPAMRSTSEFQAQVPSLAPFPEPVNWDDIEPGVNPEGFDSPDQSWNKVGGTPIILQGESEWEHNKRFLFEFSADEAGYELADGAHCYGFIDPETLEGHFSWDCH